MHFGVTEILIIVFIVLLLFGGKRLPGLARSLASSISSFRKGIDEAGKADKDSNSKQMD